MHSATPTVLYLLVLSHFVADYPLQSEFMAKHKSPLNSLAAAPWGYVLASHAAVHAIGVYLVTGSAVLSVIEFLLHSYIDYGKCLGFFGIHVDQALHLIVKVFLFALFVGGV